jgi:hypothetical protein
MQLPVIHLNGSNPEELFYQVCAALGAIREAAFALETCTPNGRDYYPAGPEALQQALREHQSRQEKLQQIRKELEELSEHLCDEMDKRKKV